MLNIQNEVLVPANVTESEFRIEIAVMLYAKGKLSFGQAKKLANLDVFSFQAALANNNIPMNYGIDDYYHDLQTIDKLGLGKVNYQ